MEEFIEIGDVGIVKYLLKVNICDLDKITGISLISACSKAHLEMVKLLVEYGIEINNNDNKLISVTSYKDDSNIIMEISDNAGGIPKKIIGQIFDPYFSTKKNKNGTGLGLYMSKSIIEKQGNGILGVRNENNGAIFSITLPIK